MKKILFTITMCLLFLTGCNNKTIENKDIQENKDNKSSIQVKVDNLDISLKSTGSFNGITYKYPTEALTSNLGTYSIMDYMDGSKFVFRIAMYFFENKSLSEAMKDASVESIGTKNINGKLWNLYKGKNKDGKDLINYAFEYDKGTYTITFIFDNNIDNLINTFMNTIEFK